MPSIISKPNGMQLEFLPVTGVASDDETVKRLDMDTPDTMTPVSEGPLSTNEFISTGMPVKVHSRVVIDYTVYPPMYRDDVSAAQRIIDQATMTNTPSSGSDSFASTRSNTEDPNLISSVRRDRRAVEVPVGDSREAKIAAVTKKAKIDIVDAISFSSNQSIDAQVAKYNRDAPTPLGSDLKPDVQRGPIEMGTDVELFVEDPLDGPLASTNIPGLNAALLHMRVGQRAKVFIPAHLSFSSYPHSKKGGNTYLLSTVGQDLPKPARTPDATWREACTVLVHRLCRADGISTEEADVQALIDDLTIRSQMQEAKTIDVFYANQGGASNIFIEVVVKSAELEVDISTEPQSRYLTKHTITHGDGNTIHIGDVVDFFIAEESPTGEEPSIRSVIAFPVGGPDSCIEMDRMLTSMIVGEEARFKVGPTVYSIEVMAARDATTITDERAIKLAKEWKDRGNATLSALNALNTKRGPTNRGYYPRHATELSPDAVLSPFHGHVASGVEVNFNANVNDQLERAHRACFDQSKRFADLRNQWGTVNASCFGRRLGCVVGSQGRCRLLDTLSTYVVQPPRQPRSSVSDSQWGPPTASAVCSTPIKASPSSPHLGTMDTVSMSDVEGGSPLLIRLGQHNASDFNRVHSSPSREPTADDAPAVAPQTQRDCNTIHAANDEAALLIVVQQYEHAIGILLEDHRFEFSSNGVSDILNKSASVVELAKERFRCLRDICGNTSEVFLQLSRFQLAEIFATHSLIFESRLIELQGGDPSHDLTSSFAQKALYRRLRARIGLGDKVSGAEDVGYIRRILEVRASSGENMGCDFEDVARQEKKLQ